MSPTALKSIPYVVTTDELGPMRKDVAVEWLEQLTKETMEQLTSLYHHGDLTQAKSDELRNKLEALAMAVVALS